MAAEPNKRLKGLLPTVIFRSISHHLVRSGHIAEDGFASAEEDEDSLTGDLLRAFRRRWSKPIVIAGAQWRWCVSTRKFRGRGELATESLIGADGILQIEIAPPKGEEARKGILFQAKKGWKYRDQSLVEQVQKMEAVAPDGSVVFDYEPDGYRAVSGALVIASEGRPTPLKIRPLGEFLAEELLECSVGRHDTYFDWNTRGLILPSFRTEFFRMYPQFLAAIQVKGTGVA